MNCPKKAISMKSEIKDYKDSLSLMNSCLNKAESFKKDENSKIALICYEKSEDFCHRHLVAYWLKCNGYECEEYKEDIHG